MITLIRLLLLPVILFVFLYVIEITLRTGGLEFFLLVLLCGMIAVVGLYILWGRRR